MKFAIGLMACIAIAFVFVTSPDTQPRASVQPASADAQAITSLTNAVESLQDSIANQQVEMESRVDAKFVAFTESLPAPAASVDLSEIIERLGRLETAKVDLEEEDIRLFNELESLRKTAAAASCPCRTATKLPVTSNASSANPVTQASYTARWHSNDGRSLRDHATQVHGFDPNLSDAQLAAQHDAYHDQFGGAAPRSPVQYAPAMRSRTVTVQSPFASSCPGGVCPTSRTRTVQSSGGPMGLGILGRRW